MGCACLISASLFAQSKTNSIAVGFHISEVQNDYGVGLDLISPYFLNDVLAVKIGGTLSWLEHVANAETMWTPYLNMQVGMRSRHFIIENKLSIYGEGGSMVLFPNSDFSSQTVIFGGYGLFGFEFQSNKKFGFYFEMGGAGANATADKIDNKPIYSNGFLTNVGFRILL